MSAPRPRRKRHGPPLRFAVPPWPAGEIQDPYGTIFRLHADRQTLIRGGALAFLIYGGVVAAALLAPRTTQVGPPPREIPVVAAAPPPAPVAPPVPHEEPPPTTARRAHRAASPAQAAKAITRAEQPSEAEADFSGFAIATGEGNQYAGGYTSAKGTSQKAVRELPAPRAPAHGPNLARRAEPARRDWRCRWPAEAESGELREARVAVTVQVSPDGEPLSTAVTGEALPGFAEAARQCAMGESYRPALDAAGQRIPSETGLLVVHFVR